ncbi:daunorubicin/doxorubicin resistance ABC transporter ATP-binding protein DrrA [Streptantibioticus cattleyicolor]|uniref:Daunorubicin resistance ABC transporter ATPase subunit n=1 Tax=Streptantibioticus cattleyicolor (strain ATCC 35852 / DSM 46488 / JCM 4925 / NBRC 14057 / NRRL 8057) TaxID=1003195 RepID=F8JJL7_STREN|nr:daunorubicin/doxorubicin resistance ABC transporter ATP-binding protein DrrA [Streptantibioticus cattleyicolor]AEW99937.1 daunorubicin resistance ABC transporter ATPase subunit [Streptantibioticus cattleyicolor NRRL 8057 = DSM 46488]CCB71031.1 Putative drug resistance ABC transporter, ATPase subunit; putative Daunorubicin/doxorubicin resistance ATP-binding protein drrA [Streptantibioticus cattleyicolor NRRL 8057 = DSM 46488]
MAGPAIEAVRLTRTFGGSTAVDAFDLTVAAGTVVSLLGPNGAGKTTIVRMLATLIRPTSGSARVCGHDITTRPQAVRSVISLTGQFTALEDTLTARENLLLMARLRGHGKRGAAKVTDWLVDRFELGAFRDQLVKTLSGGQRRRVDLAAGLVVQPRLLVLDEPTTGLDPRSRETVWSTVRELVAEGVTLLLTTQYLDEADALSDHIVLLEHGRATASGTPAQLKRRVGHQRIDVTTADATGFTRLRAALAPRFTLTGVPERLLLQLPAPHAAQDLAAVSQAVRDSGVPVEEIVLRSPTLDDVFLTLTGHPPKDRT